MNTHTFIKNKYKDFLSFAAMSGHTVYENELIKLSNLKTNRAINQNHVSIQNIFRTFWFDFKKSHDNLRPSIIQNVEAMIDCRDLSKGHLFYECDKCDNYLLTGLSCHSRFCASCGHKYRDARSIEIQRKLVNVSHRHFVFSVPFDLRPFFWKCRELFDCLFQTVSEALHKTIKLTKAERKADYRLGFVSFLHTAGRQLNPHPHLHVLLAEALISKSGHMKKLYFFPFKRLRMTVMYTFLTNASQCLKLYGDKALYNEFNRLRTIILKQYQEGFYVYGPKDETQEYQKLNSLKKVADYIARYASHPPIAESNILSLDNETKMIIWQYEDHQTKEIVKMNESVFDFMSKLIRHIPDKGFHQIRYYGFYSNRTSRIKSKPKLLNVGIIKVLTNNLKWRIMILKTFKYDVLLCSCGATLRLNIEHSFLPNNKSKEFISDA
jgi:hypothetical protein